MRARFADLAEVRAHWSELVQSLRLMASDHMPPEARPATWLRGLSWAGLLFLLGVGLLYLGQRLHLLGIW